MRPLTPGQISLSQRRTIAPVPLVIVTAYSTHGFPQTEAQEERRHATWVISKQWAFSDTAFQYDGIDVLPYLLSIPDDVHTMKHTADDGANGEGMYRNFELAIRNGKTDAFMSMIDEMRSNEIDAADILVGKILLDRSSSRTEREQLSVATLNDLDVILRGKLQQISDIDIDKFILFCNSHTPRSGVGITQVNENTSGSELFGTDKSTYVVPTIYGEPKKVPAIPFEVGFYTTLDRSASITILDFFTSDAIPSSVPSSGVIVVGGESMGYSSRTDRQVTVSARGVADAAQHKGGEVVWFSPSTTSYVAASNIDVVVGEIFIRNPVNDALMRGDGLLPQTAVTFPDDAVGFGYVEAFWTAILTLMLAKSNVTDDAVYDDGGGPTPGGPLGVGSTRSYQFGDGQSVDGRWNLGGSGRDEFEQDEQQPEEIAVRTTVPEADVAGRLVTHVRLAITINPLVIPSDLSVVEWKAQMKTQSWTGSNLAFQSSDIQFQSTGSFIILSSEIDISSQELKPSDLGGLEVQGYFDEVIARRSSGGYKCEWDAKIDYRFETTAFINLITSSQIQATAGAAGLEIFTNPRGPNATELAALILYDKPGLPLYDDTRYLSVVNGTISRKITGFHRSTVLTADGGGDASFWLTLSAAEAIDMSETLFGGWLTFQATSGRDVEMLVSNNNSDVPPTLPVNYRTFTNTVHAGVFSNLFNMSVDFNGPGTNAVRRIRISLLSPVAGNTLEIWHVGGRVAQDDLYAVTGVEVPRHPVDHIRRFLTSECRLPTTFIDEDSFAKAKADLPDAVADVVSTDWTDNNDVDFLANLCMEHRISIVTEENGESTIIRLLTSDASYEWGSSVQEITHWSEVGEQGVDEATTYTRRMYAFNPDRSVGTGIRGMQNSILIGVPQNDAASCILTTDIIDQELLVGRSDSPPLLLPSQTDDVSAEDVAAFYSTLHLVGFRLFSLQNTLWVESYALQVGDRINFTLPWYTVAIQARVLELSKNHIDETVDIVAVEVAVP